MTHRRGVLIGIAVVAAGIVGPGSVATAAGSDGCQAIGVLAASQAATASIDEMRANGCGRRTAVSEQSRTPVPLLRNVWVTDPVWAPDGSALAYGVTDYAYAATTTEIHIVPVGRGAKSTVLSLPLVGAIADLDWSPDGRRFAFSLFTYNYPALIATWSPFGSTERIYAVNRDGTGLRPVSTVNASFDNEPRWAPDSHRLAYTSWMLGVVVVDVDAPAPIPRLVSQTNAMAHSAAWSPDGRRIAFTRTERVSGAEEIWVVRANGSGARHLLNTGGAADWSPDGRHIAGGGGYNAADLWTVRPDGTHARMLMPGPVAAPAWSPDGRFLAFTRFHGQGDQALNEYGYPEPTDENAVWVIRADGRGAHRVSAPLEFGYNRPVWRPT